MIDSTKLGKPMVSICCTTFNLEKYISEALDSFLSQRTDFDFEVIIGEDCSTDSTRSIIEKYQANHPGKIKVISSPANVGVIRNYIRVIEAAQGDYLAICDGDDYWTDPGKLQKQVDFLQANEDFVICCHYSRVINAIGDLIYVEPHPVPLEHSYEDVLRESRKETRNSSMVIRNSSDFRKLIHQEWFLKCHVQDTAMKLFATYITGKKIFVMPEVMGIYRIHNSSTWSTINARVRKRKARADFATIIENFRYDGPQKRNLRNIYLKKYFVHDLRYLRVLGVIRAVRTLL